MVALALGRERCTKVPCPTANASAVGPGVLRSDPESTLMLTNVSSDGFLLACEQQLLTYLKHDRRANLVLARSCLVEKVLVHAARQSLALLAFHPLFIRQTVIAVGKCCMESGKRERLLQYRGNLQHHLLV